MAESTHLVDIDRIVVGDRIRDDYGEMTLLESSLKKWGQLLPILVDQDYVLCDGGRRLTAMRQAGFRDILVTQRAMTAEERRELELEVDRQHKPLTDLERSKRYVAKAVEAAAELKAKAADDAPEPDDLSRAGRNKSGRGAPKKAVTKQDVADAVGVDRKTISDAEQHVAAVTQFPDLASLPQKVAIKQAKKERLKGDPVAAKVQEEADARAQSKRLLAQYSQKLPKLHDIAQLDPATLASLFDDGHWLTFDTTREELTLWFDAMERARTRKFHLVS